MNQQIFTTHKFVSYQVAELLKQKGFNELVLYYYWEKDEKLYPSNHIINTGFSEAVFAELEFFYQNFNDGRYMDALGNPCMHCNEHVDFFNCFSAPTIDQVIHWLYQNHDIFINISIGQGSLFSANVLEKEIVPGREVSFRWSARKGFFSFEKVEDLYNFAFCHILQEML